MSTKSFPPSEASTAIQSRPTPPPPDLLPHLTLPPITRPLAIVAGHTYAAIWSFVRREDAQLPTSRELVFVRDDGRLMSNATHPDPTAPPAPYADAALPAAVSLLPPYCHWSAAGLQRFIAGHRPDPADVFARLVAVLNHFVDFTGSLAWPAWSHDCFLPQPDPTVQPAAELLAAYILSTWFGPALPSQGILWITGDVGSGKSRLLSLLARLSHLGVAFPGLPSSTPLLRLSGLGAALAVDNAHFLGPARNTVSAASAARRAILLAGSQRGAYWPIANRTTSGRLVHVAGPRLVATTADPDSSLAGACLVIPLVRTADVTRATRDPSDPASWPAGIDPNTLIDDLWALALSRLHQLPPHLTLVATQAAATDLRLSSNKRQPLQGAALQPWHALLAVASWLSDQTRLPPDPDAPVLEVVDRSPENYHAVVAYTTARARGVPGLFDRLLVLARVHYGTQRVLGRSDITGLALRALYDIVEADIRTARADKEASDAFFARLDEITATQGHAAAKRLFDKALALDSYDVDLDEDQEADEMDADENDDLDDAASSAASDGCDGLESDHPQPVTSAGNPEEPLTEADLHRNSASSDGYDGCDELNEVTSAASPPPVPAAPAVSSPPTPPYPNPRSARTAAAGDVPARGDLPPLVRSVYSFSAADVVKAMAYLAKDYESFIPPDQINVTLVGRLLGQLGLNYHRNNQARTWSIRPADLLRLSHAYSEPMHPQLAYNLANYQPTPRDPLG